MLFARMVVAASIAGLSAFGCEDDALKDEEARIHFHNQLTQSSGGSSSDVAVDFYVDDMNTALETNEEYTTQGNVSGNDVDLGDEDASIAFDVRGNSSGSTLINGPINFTLIGGDEYTAVMMGDTLLDNRELKLFRYQPVSVSSGQIRVRFINTLSRLSGDELLVAEVGGGQDLVSGLEYADGSSYVTLSAGSTLEVSVQNETQGLEIDQVSCSVSSGRSYDAIIAYRDFDSADDELDLFCQPY